MFHQICSLSQVSDKSHLVLEHLLVTLKYEVKQGTYTEEEERTVWAISLAVVVVLSKRVAQAPESKKGFYHPSLISVSLWFHFPGSLS